MDTPPAHEETDRFHRFKLALQPGAEVTFTVSERTRQWGTYYLQSATENDVQFYLASRYIDARIAAALREVVALRTRSQELYQEEQRLQQERGEIFQDQERIRNNMKSLTGGAEQQQLVERLVRKLDAQEDRLEQLTAAVTRLQQERASIDQQVQQRVQDLAFTAELGEADQRAR